MINTPVTIAGRIVSDSVYIGRKDNLDGVLRIRVASSRSYKQGEKWHNVDKVFINVEAWGKLGVNSHISLKPGVSVIVQGFLYTNEWEVESADPTDPTVKKLEKRQEIRMRATSIGIDMNHYIVGFKESKPNASNSPEGVEMPDSNFEDYPDVDRKRGAKQVASSDEASGEEAAESAEEGTEEKRELAMAGSRSGSGEKAPF